MNEISNVNETHAVTPLTQRSVGGKQLPVPASHGSPQDEVEISEVGAMLAKLRDMPDIRVEKIARIRAEIATGTFVTPERLAGTVDRLFEELG